MAFAGCGSLEVCSEGGTQRIENRGRGRGAGATPYSIRDVIQMRCFASEVVLWVVQTRERVGEL